MTCLAKREIVWECKNYVSSKLLAPTVGVIAFRFSAIVCDKILPLLIRRQQKRFGNTLTHTLLR